MSKPLAPTRRREHNNDAQAFEIDEVATDLILKYGSTILRDARRYSACQADAEDAYQQSLVIMLTKAPSTEPDELIPWLRVIVRREAAAIARSRKRSQARSFDDEIDAVDSLEASPDEQALESFDAAVGAEALEKLKPDQVKCLLAQADGKTYAEISAATGFSPRKVARCVNEGRRAFTLRFEEIEAGSECSRVDGLLDKITRGDEEATASTRAHLRNCGACRIAVRGYEEAPRRARVLFPPALLAVPHAGAANDSPFDNALALWQGITDRLQTSAHAVHSWSESATAKKAIAVVAATGAAVGGGAAIKHAHPFSDSHNVVGGQVQPPPAPRQPLYDAIARPVGSTGPIRPKHRRRHQQIKASSAAPRQAKPPQPLSESNQATGDGSSEFLPEQR